MKEPYYMVDFNAGACFFEIRVNDQPVLAMNLKGQASTMIPVNYAIHKSGKQEVSIKVLPLLGNTSLSQNAELSYTVKLFDTSRGFELKNEFSGFESKPIEEQNIPLITNTSFFEATINYNLRDFWLDGLEISKIKDYELKLKQAYLKIIKLIKEEKFDILAKQLENREYNMATSMYLSEKDAKKRVSNLINDFKNGYNVVLFDEKAVPVISAYNKKVALKNLNGEPALAFGNREENEQLMLDVEFYYSKETKRFEII
jgi:hypothetical protein